MSCKLNSTLAYKNSKQYLIDKGVMDKYHNILHLGNFRIHNRILAEAASKKYGTSFTRFWVEDNDGKKALPVEPEIRKVDLIRQNMDTGTLDRKAEGDIDTTIRERFQFQQVEDRALADAHEILDTIILSNPELAQQASFLKQHLPEGVTISLVDRTPEEQSGRYYTDTEEIEIEEFGKHTLGWVDATILHEIAHLLSYKAAFQEVEAGEGPLIDLYNEIAQDLFENAPEILEEYGMSDIYEFLSEVYSNKEFVNKLGERNKTWYEKLFSILYKALGISTAFEKKLFRTTSEYIVAREKPQVEVSGSSKVNMSPSQAAVLKSKVDRYNEGEEVSLSYDEALALLEMFPEAKSLSSRLPWYSEMLENGLSIEDAKSASAVHLFRALFSKNPIFSNQEYEAELLKDYQQLDIQFPESRNYLALYQRTISPEIQTLEIENHFLYPKIYLSESVLTHDAVRQELTHKGTQISQKIVVISSTKRADFATISPEDFIEELENQLEQRNIIVWDFPTKIREEDLPDAVGSAVLTSLKLDSKSPEYAAAIRNIRKSIYKSAITLRQFNKKAVFLDPRIRNYDEELKILESRTASELYEFAKELNNKARTVVRQMSNKNVQDVNLVRYVDTAQSSDAEYKLQHGKRLLGAASFYRALLELKEMYTELLKNGISDLDYLSAEDKVTRIQHLIRFNKMYLSYLRKLSTAMPKLEVVRDVVGQITAFDDQLKTVTIDVMVNTLAPHFAELNENLTRQWEDQRLQLEKIGAPQAQIDKAEAEFNAKFITGEVLAKALRGEIEDQSWLGSMFSLASESSHPLVAVFAKLINDEKAEAELEVNRLIGDKLEEIQAVKDALAEVNIPFNRIGEHITYVEQEFNPQDPDNPRERLFYLSPFQGLEFDHDKLSYEKDTIRRQYDLLKSQVVPETATTEDEIRALEKDQRAAIAALEREHRKLYHDRYTEEYYDARDILESHPQHEAYKELTRGLYDEMDMIKEDMNIEGNSPEQLASLRALYKEKETAIRQIGTELKSDDPAYPGSMSEYVDARRVFNKTYRDWTPDFLSFAKSLRTILSRRGLDTQVAKLESAMDEVLQGDSLPLTEFLLDLRNNNDSHVKEFLRESLAFHPNDAFYAARDEILIQMNQSIFRLNPDEHFHGKSSTALIDSFKAKFPDFEVFDSFDDLEEAIENGQDPKKAYYVTTEKYLDEHGNVKGSFVIKNRKGFIQKNDLSGTPELWERIFEIVINHRNSDGTIDAIALERNIDTTELHDLEQEIEDIKRDILLGRAEMSEEKKVLADEVLKELGALAEELSKIQARELTDDYFIEMELKLSGVAHREFNKFKNILTDAKRDEKVAKMLGSAWFRKFLLVPNQDPSLEVVRQWFIRSTITGYKKSKGQVISVLRPTYAYHRITPRKSEHFELRLQPKFSTRSVKQEFHTNEKLFDWKGRGVPKAASLVNGEVTYNLGHPKINQAYFNMSPAVKRAHKLIVEDLHMAAQKDMEFSSKLGYKAPGVEVQGFERGYSNWWTRLWSIIWNRKNLTEEEGEEHRKTSLKEMALNLMGQDVSNFPDKRVKTDPDGYEIKSFYTGYTHRLDPAKTSKASLLASLLYISEGKRMSRVQSKSGVYEVLNEIMEEQGHKEQGKIAKWNAQKIKRRGTYRAQETITNLANDELYGERMHKIPSRGLANFLRFMNSFSIFRTMSLIAPVNNIKNWAAGSLVNAIHSNNLFSIKDYRKASTNISRLSFTYAAMKFGDVPKSKDFHIFSMFNSTSDKFVERFGLPGHRKSLINLSSILYLGQEVGELNISAQYIFAALHHFTKEVNGQKVSLYDSLEFQNGRLVPTGPFTEEDVTSIIRKIRSFRYMTTGQSSEKTQIERYEFGSIAMLFRRYLVPTLYTRFGATRMNLAKGEYVTGSTRAILRAFKSMATLNKADLLASTETERNARYTSMKAALGILVLYMTITKGFGFDPDDDDRYKKLKEASAAKRILLMSALKALNESQQLSLSGGGMGNYGVFTTALENIQNIFAFARPYKDIWNMSLHLLTGEEYKSSKKGEYQKGDKKWERDFGRLVSKNFSWSKFYDVSVSQIQGVTR